MDITSTVGLNTFWNQYEINSQNPNNIISDQGQIIYNHTYNSGSVASGINSVFHEVNSLSASGVYKIYDLMNLTGS